MQTAKLDTGYRLRFDFAPDASSVTNAQALPENSLPPQKRKKKPLGSMLRACVKHVTTLTPKQWTSIGMREKNS
jgi:hypothetical protein